MKEDTTKGSDDRPAPMPDLPAPLSSLGGPMRNQGVQAGSGVNAITPVQTALRKLAARGYRIHSGGIFYIANDDPDQGLEEVLIANWDGPPQDAYSNLELHNWPTSPFILCSCGEGEADFGGLCHSCNREAVEWFKVGEYM